MNRKPQAVPARRDKPFREARSSLRLTHHDLLRLHNRRLPFALLGDFRTPKSNALKHGAFPTTHLRKVVSASGRIGPVAIHSARRGHVPLDASSCPRDSWTFGPLDPGTRFRAPPSRSQPHYTDPNKGAAARKILPITRPWSQTLTLERRRQNPWLAHHYLLCPQCKTRRKKLFMPLCTPQELKDAHTALAWLNRFNTQHHTVGQASGLSFHRRWNQPGTPLEAQLIDRYYPLFNPTLLCRQCLNLRYGYARFTGTGAIGAKHPQGRVRRTGQSDLSPFFPRVAKGTCPPPTPNSPMNRKSQAAGRKSFKMTPLKRARLLLRLQQLNQLRRWTEELSKENPNAPKEIVPKRSGAMPSARRGHALSEIARSPHHQIAR